DAQAGTRGLQSCHGLEQAGSNMISKKHKIKVVPRANFRQRTGSQLQVGRRSQTRAQAHKPQRVALYHSNADKLSHDLLCAEIPLSKELLSRYFRVKQQAWRHPQRFLHSDGTSAAVRKAMLPAFNFPCGIRQIEAAPPNLPGPPRRLP